MWEIEAIVRSVIWQLVSKDYEGLIKRCPRSQYTADEIRIAVEQYGRTLVMPPASGYENLVRTYEVQGAEHPTWEVEAPLWTSEEGRSDLEIWMRVIYGFGEPTILVRAPFVP